MLGVIRSPPPILSTPQHKSKPLLDFAEGDSKTEMMQPLGTLFSTPWSRDHGGVEQWVYVRHEATVFMNTSEPRFRIP